MPALFLSFSISFRNPAFCLHLIYIFIILVKQPYCPSENHHRVHGIYFTICIYICTNRLYCIQTFNAHCRSQCHHCIQRIYLPIPINIAQCIPPIRVVGYDGLCYWAEGAVGILCSYGLGR